MSEVVASSESSSGSETDVSDSEVNWVALIKGDEIMEDSDSADENYTSSDVTENSVSDSSDSEFWTDDRGTKLNNKPKTTTNKKPVANKNIINDTQKKVEGQNNSSELKPGEEIDKCTTAAGENTPVLPKLASNNLGNLGKIQVTKLSAKVMEPKPGSNDLTGPLPKKRGRPKKVKVSDLKLPESGPIDPTMDERP